MDIIEMQRLIEITQSQILTSNDIYPRTFCPYYNHPGALANFRNMLVAHRNSSLKQIYQLSRQPQWQSLFNQCPTKLYNFAVSLVSSAMIYLLRIGDALECATALAIQLTDNDCTDIVFINIEFPAATANMERTHHFIVANLPQDFACPDNIPIYDFFRMLPPNAVIGDAFLKLSFSPQDIPAGLRYYINAYGRIANVAYCFHFGNLFVNFQHNYLQITEEIMQNPAFFSTLPNRQHYDLGSKTRISNTALITLLNEMTTLTFFGVIDRNHKVDAITKLESILDWIAALSLQDVARRYGRFFQQETGSYIFILEGINLSDPNSNIKDHLFNFLSAAWLDQRNVVVRPASKSTAPVPQKRPQVFRDALTMPHLFSFNFNTNTSDPAINNALLDIQSMIPFINDLASRKTSNINPQQLHFLLQRYSHQANQALEIARTHQHPAAAGLYIRANLCLFVISKRFNYLFDLIKIAKLLAEQRQLTPELSWYYASAIFVLYIRDQVCANKAEGIKHLFRALYNIEGALSNYKQTIMKWILDLYKKTSYPQPAVCIRLKELTPEYPRDYMSKCVHARHKVILRSLQHPEYFKFQTSPLIEATATAAQKLSLEIPPSINPKAQRVSIEISNKILFKFAAHLKSPSKPIIRLNIKDMSKHQSKQLTFAWHKKLREAGFIGSEGFIPEYRDDDHNPLLMEKHFQKIQQCLVEALREANIQPPSGKSLEEVVKEKQTYEKLKADYLALENIRAGLAGMTTIPALLLFHRCLIEHPYGLRQALLDQVRNVVLLGLSIAHEAENISKLSQRKKGDEWLNLATRIVNYLRINKTNLVIPVSTPIKEVKEGEKASKHGVYVAFKYLPTSQQYQVIISNGGRGVRKFHQKSAAVEKCDRKRYHYAAFAPFALTGEATINALRYYIYRLISLKFTPSAKDDLGQATTPRGNTYGYTDLYSNVYLRSCNSREEEFFYNPFGSRAGGLPEKIKVFRRADLEKCFGEQITGNCNVYNLTNVLTVLFNMDPLTGGLLIDNLLLGLDALVSQTMPPSLCPSPEAVPNQPANAPHPGFTHPIGEYQLTLGDQPPRTFTLWENYGGGDCGFISLRLTRQMVVETIQRGLQTPAQQQMLINMLAPEIINAYAKDGLTRFPPQLLQELRQAAGNNEIFHGCVHQPHIVEAFVELYRQDGEEGLSFIQHERPAQQPTIGIMDAIVATGLVPGICIWRLNGEAMNCIYACGNMQQALHMEWVYPNHFRALV